MNHHRPIIVFMISMVAATLATTTNIPPSFTPARHFNNLKLCPTPTLHYHPCHCKHHRIRHRHPRPHCQDYDLRVICTPPTAMPSPTPFPALRPALAITIVITGNAFNPPLHRHRRHHQRRYTHTFAISPPLPFPPSAPRLPACPHGNPITPTPTTPTQSPSRITL